MQRALGAGRQHYSSPEDACSTASTSTAPSAVALYGQQAEKLSLLNPSYSHHHTNSQSSLGNSSSIPARAFNSETGLKATSTVPAVIIFISFLLSNCIGTVPPQHGLFCVYTRVGSRV